MLIAVIVCLAVSISLIFASLQIATRSRQDAKSLGLSHQISFLLDAGIARAKDQLNASAKYQGESWTPRLSRSTEEPISDLVASIQILVNPNTAEAGAEELLVEVIARIESSDASALSIQRSRQFTFLKPKA